MSHKVIDFTDERFALLKGKKVYLKKVADSDLVAIRFKSFSVWLCWLNGNRTSSTAYKINSEDCVFETADGNTFDMKLSDRLVFELYFTRWCRLNGYIANFYDREGAESEVICRRSVGNGENAIALKGEFRVLVDCSTPNYKYKYDAERGKAVKEDTTAFVNLLSGRVSSYSEKYYATEEECLSANKPKVLDFEDEVDNDAELKSRIKTTTEKIEELQNELAQLKGML